MTRVIFKDEDILPGAVIVGPVWIIDENGESHQANEGAWLTQAEAEAVARKHGVELEVE